MAAAADTTRRQRHGCDGGEGISGLARSRQTRSVSRTFYTPSERSGGGGDNDGDDTQGRSGEN